MIRPAALLSLPEGQRVWQAMGPDFANAQRQWEATSGVLLGEVEQLTISLHDTESGSPAAFFVVQLPQPVATEQLWPSGETQWQPRTCRTFIRRNPGAYYVPADAEGRVFVMGPADSRLWPTLARGSARELLRWQVAGCSPLRRSTARHADLRPQLSVCRRPIAVCGACEAGASRLRGCSAKASMRVWSASTWARCSSSRFASENDVLTPPSHLAETLGRRWKEIPAAVENHLASINPHPYWRRVAFRLPSMLRFVVEQTRWGVDRGQFVLNGVLPELPHIISPSPPT